MNVTREDESTIAKVCLGINPGYFHNNGASVNSDWYIIKSKIQDLLKDAENECGTYISFTLNYGDVIYKPEWGCPRGGEAVILLEATRNPEFNPRDDEWRRAVQCAVRKLKDFFKQSTVTLTFSSATIVYMK